MLDYTPTNALSLQEKQEQFALNVAHLIIHIFESGYKCTLGEAFRTIEQAQIYAKAGLGISHSKHCERLAIDINLFDSTGRYIYASDKEYEALGVYWEKLTPGNRAGEFFRTRVDCGHYEMD